jgi:2-haloacid dehalogenase
LRKEEIVFAAFGGWDAVGAKWFGYPTFCVNRAHVAAEELGTVPEWVGKDLDDLAACGRRQMGCSSQNAVTVIIT